MNMEYQHLFIRVSFLHIDLVHVMSYLYHVFHFGGGANVNGIVLNFKFYLFIAGTQESN